MYLAAEFLLEYPPICELHDSISDVVERYRYKTITKPEALSLMLTEHLKYVTSFRNTQKELSKELFELDQQFTS